MNLRYIWGHAEDINVSRIQIDAWSMLFLRNKKKPSSTNGIGGIQDSGYRRMVWLQSGNKQKSSGGK